MKEMTYPDSNGAHDVVRMQGALDGRLTKRTSQGDAEDHDPTVIEYDYDTGFRRLTKQKVTTVGTGVDDRIRSIQYTYDANAQLTRVTSYHSSDCTGDPNNDILCTYNHLGILAAEYQDHGGAAGTTAPNVQYDPNDTAASGEYTKGMRPKQLRYPNGRRVHYTYGASAGLDEAVGRIAALSADDGSGGVGDVLASYLYDGAGRIVAEDYEDPSVRLDFVDLDNWAANKKYVGFDPPSRAGPLRRAGPPSLRCRYGVASRFGQVKQQWWWRYATGDEVCTGSWRYTRRNRNKCL